jgi:hypothetical protein
MPKTLLGHTHPVDSDPHALSHEELVRVWEQSVIGVVGYGFTIRYAKLDPPKTGTFNGLEIILRPDNPLEMQAFILLHLFGHCVQWVAPSLAETTARISTAPNLEAFLVELKRYEGEAAEFGMRLLHERGVFDVDHWFSDFATADWKYVEGYYRTGRIPSWESCQVFAAPLFTPKTIPPLEHRKVQVRFAF